VERIGERNSGVASGGRGGGGEMGQEMKPITEVISTTLEVFGGRDSMEIGCFLVFGAKRSRSNGGVWRENFSRRQAKVVKRR
jgi:hypothetical protein